MDNTNENNRTSTLTSVNENLNYKFFVESSMDMIYTINDAGDLTYANPAASRLLGYTNNELIGINFSKLIRPESRNLIKKFYDSQIAEKNRTSFLEIPFLKKDGNTL